MKSKKVGDKILELRTKAVQYKQDVGQTYLKLLSSNVLKLTVHI